MFEKWYRCYMWLIFALHFLGHTEAHPGQETTSLRRHDVANESDTLVVFSFCQSKFERFTSHKSVYF